MNIDMKDMWKKIVVALSSFGLLSSLGYYLINLENRTLGKAEVVQPRATQIIEVQTPAAGMVTVVTTVVDGDTIKVRAGDANMTVRLIGIDTPETRHSPRAKVRGVADCLANEATARLAELIQGKQVTLETDPSKDTKDRYDRLLSYVWLGDININQVMIQDGYAYEYTYRGEKYKYQQAFKQAQKDAEQNQQGLWASGVCK